MKDSKELAWGFDIYRQPAFSERQGVDGAEGNAKANQQLAANKQTYAADQQVQAAEQLAEDGKN